MLKIMLADSTHGLVCKR